MRFHEPCLLAAVAIARLCEAADTMQLPWTTDPAAADFPTGVFGPDGPWQATAALVGGSRTNHPNGMPVPFWPSVLNIIQIPTAKTGGNYSAEDSSSAVEAKSVYRNIFRALSFNYTDAGLGYFDSITLEEKINVTPAQTNGSIIAEDEYYRTFPDGRQLNESVGVLGLGPGREPFKPDFSGGGYPSILEQLKSDKKIGSTSFSVHVGSAVFNQAGSLILGGYEQNRVIGPTGVFALVAKPVIFLLDVVIGVETGGSPFDRPVPTSVYARLDDYKSSFDTTRQYGGNPGSTVVAPDATVPYIYLPPGICEEATKHLPVFFDSGLELYLWNTSDPQFVRIVSSSAYLAFTFSDRTVTNLTIKVPFSLLNLTLTAPLVDKPTAYFPCKSLESPDGWWVLGRAFLQAAFFAVNYDANVTFLAQAPGPDIGQSVIKAVKEDDEALEGLGSDAFETSWRSSWTVLPNAEGAGGGLSPGAMAGIVVGVVLLVGAAVATVLFLRRKKNTGGGEGEKVPFRRLWNSRRRQAEIEGTPVQELDVPNAVHEAPGKLLASELPASALEAELPASPLNARPPASPTQ